MDAKQKREEFKRIISEPGIVVAPGAYDALSALLIQRAGFKVVYVTGAGVSASSLGKPDLGLTTMTEMVQVVKNIANRIDIPVISDADTGYGNPINVMRTVKEFELAGVAAIHIEDQEMPKRCGHLSGKKIIPQEEMVQKIKAAIEARGDPNFMIIARTDARALLGLEEALRRSHAYVEAGADIIFVEAPENKEELATIANTFRVPVLINRGGAGRTPPLSVEELEEMGFKIVIFPGDLQRAAAKIMMDLLSVIKRDGNTLSFQKNMISFEERFEILGIHKIEELERKFSARS